jgi:hypothetical protein
VVDMYIEPAIIYQDASAQSRRDMCRSREELTVDCSSGVNVLTANVQPAKTPGLRFGQFR